MFEFAKSIAGSSNFSLRREKAPTLSDAGASNRCQLMPARGTEFGVLGGTVAEQPRHDPANHKGPLSRPTRL